MRTYGIHYLERGIACEVTYDCPSILLAIGQFVEDNGDLRGIVSVTHIN